MNFKVSAFSFMLNFEDLFLNKKSIWVILNIYMM